METSNRLKPTPATLARRTSHPRNVWLRIRERPTALPAKLALNQWGLGGSWNAGGERTTLQAAPGKAVFRFHSRDLHMVLGPSKNGTPARFKVKLNGAAPGRDHGSDSAADGAGEVRAAPDVSAHPARGNNQRRDV